MSVFNRIAGTEEPRIRSLYILNDFRKLFDNVITETQLEVNHNISSTEDKAELAEYKIAIATKVTTLHQLLRLLWQLDTRVDLSPQVKAGAEALALKNARGLIFLELFVSVLQIEQGAITIAEFRTSLGLSNS